MCRKCARALEYFSQRIPNNWIVLILETTEPRYRWEIRKQKQRYTHTQRQRQRERESDLNRLFNSSAHHAINCLYKNLPLVVIHEQHCHYSKGRCFYDYSIYFALCIAGRVLRAPETAQTKIQDTSNWMHERSCKQPTWFGLAANRGLKLFINTIDKISTATEWDSNAET